MKGPFEHLGGHMLHNKISSRFQAGAPQMNGLKKWVIAFGTGVLVLAVCERPANAQKYSDWSTPVNVGAAINSPFDDGNPAISKDRLSLYFASTRPGGYGRFDIYVAHRDSLDSSWNAPVNLGPVINTASSELAPALSRDEHYLFFVSPRASGLADIWVSFREKVHDDFAWQAPFILGSPINTPTIDTTPSYFENDELGVPQLYFASSRPGGLGGTDIYMSDLANGAFGPVVLLPELSSPQTDSFPSIFRNGLEIFLASDRFGTLGGLDLWVSVRETVFDRWSAPVNLGVAVNGEFNDMAPAISSDGETLFFASNRPGGYGGIDIYMTTRAKLRDHR
jgi:Tol biopolymer transport system component